jgi:hypothetical protein
MSDALHASDMLAVSLGRNKYIGCPKKNGRVSKADAWKIVKDIQEI